MVDRKIWWHVLYEVLPLYRRPSTPAKGRTSETGGEAAGMDTSASTPRRWSVEVDGIRWLPRMIDKARMHRSGRLGAYLLGHSPVDRALLMRLGLTTEQFAEIVDRSPDDQAVLTALRARGCDEERVRRWSARFPATYRIYIRLWDIDEGYVRPNAVQAIGLAAFRPIEGAVMDLVRRVRRAP